MSSACVCHTDEWCFYCEMYLPLEKKCEDQAKEIEKAVTEIQFQVKRNDKQREVYFKTEKLFLLAVKALEQINTKFMDYIENNIECDSAATTMDEIAEKALEEIKRLGEGVNK